MFGRFFTFFILSFWLSPAFSNVCLHPLEEAALLHGRSKPRSLSSQVKAKEKELSAIERNKEKLEEKIEDLVEDLSNSLKENSLYNKLQTGDKGDEEDVANLIVDYIESKQSEWEEPSDMPWSEDPDKYFKSRGRVDDDFCDDFATNNRDCKKAIKGLSKYLKAQAQLDDKTELIEDQLFDLQGRQLDVELGLAEEEDTEAGALCWDCLDEIRELDKPTTGQMVGNALSLVAGGALSYFGYRAGKRGAQSVNDLRLRQGFDPLSTAGPSWAGATLGMPFIANGIYGFANGNSVLGNYACSPGFAGGGAMYGPFSGGAYPGFGGGMGFPGGFGGGMGFPGGFGGGMGYPGGFGGGFPGGFGGGFAMGGFPGFGGGFGGGMGFPGGFGGGFPGGFGGGFPGLSGGFAMGGFPGFGGGFGGGMGFPGGFGGGMGFPGGFGGGMGFPGGFGGGMGFPGGFGGGMGFPGGFGGGMGFPGGFGGGMGFPGGFGGGMGFPGGFGGGMGFPGGFGGGMGVPGGFGGMNPYAQAQMQAQAQAQQQYASYIKLQQTQMQAQIQAQQAWLQHQQSIQQDYMQRQQVIGGLTQEMFKIQQQIQMVASGGIGSSSSLGVSAGGINAGLNLGGPNAPTHNPTPSVPSPPTGGDLPVVPGR